ncbi:MAG: DUF4091 domain-containing protein [Candidatus Saganbacteria bacterium]|nr:DUF4091 domain-containing protein [Candidatus Saganbacteria bacterium]
MFQRIIIISFLLLFSIAVWAAISVLSPDSALDLALGKKYQLEPGPNFPARNDASDLTSLTDGQYVKGKPWSLKGAVGWKNTSPVVMTVDLGETQPIAGFSYNAAINTNMYTTGILFPGAIFILVSDDGNIWHYEGDLVALSGKTTAPTVSGPAVYRFQSMGFKTHGRYVKFVVAPRGAYTYADEIGVYKGPDAYLMKPFTGPKIADLPAFFTKMRTAAFLRLRLANDLAAVTRELNSGGFPDHVSGPLNNKLKAIAKKIPAATIDLPDTFSTIFPINDLHRSIFAVQAGIWRAQGLRRTVCWQTNRWDMLNPITTPVRGNASINMAMMNNEYRGEVFNLSNAGNTDAKVTLTLKGLPGGTDPSYVEFHEVLFTDTQPGVPVAAALPLIQHQKGIYAIKIPAGLTCQVWLNFHPKNVKAGEYNGRLILGSDAVSCKPIPVRLKIYPLRFPDQPALHVSGWDYTDRERIYAVTPLNRGALVQQLCEHFVDSPWGTLKVLPTGKFDANGHMIQSPDPLAFYTWLQLWPNARNYLVFVNVKESFAGFQIGTPAFQQAVTDWINWWCSQLEQWDIKPNRLGLLLVDEPRTPEQDRIIIEYANIILAAQPEVIIWEDPSWSDPSKGTPDLFTLSRVLSPHLSVWISHDPNFDDFYIKQRDAGHKLWFYSTFGPSRLLDPYIYYRLQEWFAWKYKAEGSSFWSFSDASEVPSWKNEYLGNGAPVYSPLFIDSKSVTPSKQMEAIREGVEDYEYLCMLRDRVEQLEKQDVEDQAVTSARVLLDTAADRVTAPITDVSLSRWDTAKDRTIADRVRREILEKLTELSSLLAK